MDPKIRILKMNISKSKAKPKIAKEFFKPNNVMLRIVYRSKKILAAKRIKPTIKSTNVTTSFQVDY